MYAREIRYVENKLLVWAVSQANDAHDRQFIDYSMLDNSRTGKAGEADIIIGIVWELDRRGREHGASHLRVKEQAKRLARYDQRTDRRERGVLLMPRR